MQEKNETTDELEDLFPASLDSLVDTKDSSLNLENTSDKKDELQEEVKDFLEEETTETTETEGIKPSHERVSSSPSIVSPLALALREKGVLTTIDEAKLKDIKEVYELLDMLVEDRKNSMFKELNDPQKKYLDALLHGIPEEEIKQDLQAEEAYASLSPEDLEGTDEKVINIQKQIVFNELISKGFTQEKASKFVKNSESTGSLAEDAKESLITLQEQSKKTLNEKIAKAKLAESEEVESRKTQVAKLKQEILAAEEFIPGYKVSENIKNKVFETMTTVVQMDGKVPLNAIAVERKKDPVAFDKKLAFLFQITNSFTDFKPLQQATKTSAINTLKEQIAQGGNLNGKASKAPLSTNTEEFLSILRKEGMK